MQDTGSGDEVTFDPEPERMLRKRLKAAKLGKETMGDINQPRRTMGDYCKRTDADQIS
ncbi:hypothetical protein A2U01_0102760, partial [Trifolium medium]|nr:hypothetical protein [Trifolium medium]